MGAELGTAAEQGLTMERIKTFRDLTRMREIKKVTGPVACKKLDEAIEDLEADYNILNLVREDVNHDGLEILEHIRKKKLADPKAEATCGFSDRIAYGLDTEFTQLFVDRRVRYRCLTGTLWIFDTMHIAMVGGRKSRSKPFGLRLGIGCLLQLYLSHAMG